MMTITMSLQNHISDDEPEKFFLDIIPEQDHRDRIEGHIMICSLCSMKADWNRDYVRTMKVALRTLHDAGGESRKD